MTLEQRLERLEAIEAIKQLKSRYFHACDTKQPDKVRDCFAAGEIDLTTSASATSVIGTSW